MLIVVITTINEPTQSVIELHQRLNHVDAILIVVGDKKGPDHYGLTEVVFQSFEMQQHQSFNLSRVLPAGHYARKNLGYLEAVKRGASVIYETDDDNAPLATWHLRDLFVDNLRIVVKGNNRWVNIYKYFSDENIWPRGLPLEEISTDLIPISEVRDYIRAPVQQGLVNGSPDVDAIWRLAGGKEFSFFQKSSIWLEPGLWSPFNTQSTWWWPEAYPLLYIPSNCSFRMCDIWKSFIAQRCLWELDYGLVFHPPEVYQDRNEHSLIKDFEDEIPGYLGNQRFVSVLENLTLKSGDGNVIGNMIACYDALIKNDFFPKEEYKLVRAWADDIEKILNK